MQQPIPLKNWPLIPAYGARGKRNSIYSGEGRFRHLVPFQLDGHNDDQGSASKTMANPLRHRELEIVGTALALVEQENKEDSKNHQGGGNSVQKPGVVQSPWSLAGTTPLRPDEAWLDLKEYLREVMHTLELRIRKVRERPKRRTAEIGVSLKDREQEERLSLEHRLRKVEQAQKTAARKPGAQLEVGPGETGIFLKRHVQK